MSEPENFLTRWSRRKLEPADEKVSPEAAADAAVEGDAVAEPAVGAAPDREAAPLPEFDPSKLPSLDSIGANTDIRVFLQPGVPLALRHAALRRAWSADPAIRDYIGPADYAWDFTDPKAMPGFGDLGPDVDVKKLVADVFRGIGQESQPPADTPVPAPPLGQSARLSDKSDIIADIPAAKDPATAQQLAAATESREMVRHDKNIATQNKESEAQPSATVPRRHGGAMPQ